MGYHIKYLRNVLGETLQCCWPGVFTSHPSTCFKLMVSTFNHICLYIYLCSSSNDDPLLHGCCHFLHERVLIQVDHSGQPKCWRTAGKSAGVPLAFCGRPIGSLCLEAPLIVTPKKDRKGYFHFFNGVVPFCLFGDDCTFVFYFHP